MNPNIAYEKFTQEVYQEIVNTDVVKTTVVQHNVKLKGLSGCDHQIDVYWEYEIAGIKHKVAIECKNYDKLVPIGKVRDFYGVLSDLNNVVGVMVTKVGYQSGAKTYAKEKGIRLQELRAPNPGEAIVGQIELKLHMLIRHCLFMLDEQWVVDHKVDIRGYLRLLSQLDLQRADKWDNATYIPLPLQDNNIRNEHGQIISSLDKLENSLPEDSTSDKVFNFTDAYVNTRYWGQVKICEVKYEYEHDDQSRIISIDAQMFTKAILKDAISGKMQLISK